MRRSGRDAATLAFTAPMVVAARSWQMATGAMTPAEFTRMWVEKPIAFASAMAAMQAEIGLAALAVMSPRGPGDGWTRVAGSGMRPLARAVSANHRRLTR